MKGTQKSGSLLGSASSMSLGVLKILKTVKDNTSSSPGVNRALKRVQIKHKFHQVAMRTRV